MNHSIEDLANLLEMEEDVYKKKEKKRAKHVLFKILHKCVFLIVHNRF